MYDTMGKNKYEMKRWLVKGDVVCGGLCLKGV
jgi:hypothetical protein